LKAEQFGRSFTYIINKNGPRTEPFGTSQELLANWDLAFLIVV